MTHRPMLRPGQGWRARAALVAALAAAGEVFLVTLVVTGRAGAELDRREVRFVIPPRR